MRVISGKYRGKKLTTPTNNNIRPTSDRVRETIFNILSSGDYEINFAETRVVDFYAGTGAMGIEALSRGAKFVLFIDNDYRARSIIRQNVEIISGQGSSKIWRRDASNLNPVSSLQPFSLAFIDPPYGKGLAEKTISSAIAGKWFAKDALIIVEEDSNCPLAQNSRYNILEVRKYGSTSISFIRII